MTSPARSLLLCLALLAACATGGGAPDPRDGFTERNVGQTLVTYVEGLGTQVVHMGPDGNLYLWSAAQPRVQPGRWRYDTLTTGAATSFQGAGGINYPVEQLETAWGICFQYLDATGQILRRPGGGDWNCAVLDQYEALVIERAPGDVFGLATRESVPQMPAGERLGLAALTAL